MTWRVVALRIHSFSGRRFGSRRGPLVVTARGTLGALVASPIALAGTRLTGAKGWLRLMPASPPSTPLWMLMVYIYR